MGKRLHRGEGWVVERNGRWQAQWRDGDRVRAKTFATEGEALEHLREIAREKRQGRYVAPSELVVRDLIADYMERTRDDWSGNTYTTHARRAASFILPTLGNVRVVELDTPRLQHWADDLRRKKVAPSTIGSARAVLGGALKQAVQLGIIRANPMTGVSTPTVRPATHETWTLDEMRAALETVREEPLWHALYRLMLTTGMRPGEARALRWSDLDLPRRTVTVAITMTRSDAGRTVVGEETKTHKRRKILLPPSTVTALRTWQTAQKVKRLAATVWDDTGYVFTGTRGQPLSQRMWQLRHEQLWRSAGVKRITLHELRHTYATIELAAGTPVKVVSIRLGHSKVQITMDLYQHVTDEMQESAVDAMEARLG